MSQSSTNHADQSPSSRGNCTSLAKVTMLRMALRISLVVVAVSLLSYMHLMHKLEAGVKEELAVFVSQRAKFESSWFTYLDRKLPQMRSEYLERYERMKDRELPVGLFERYFKRNDDGSAYVRNEYYTGASGPLGINYRSYSGGVDKSYPLTADRRLRLVLSMEMLFEHCPAVVLPATESAPATTPFVNCYFFLPEEDLLIYWPGTPWYPDYKSDFDLASQGDFSKTMNASLPIEKRDRLWTGTYMDVVPKIWMSSFTIPIDHGGKPIAGIGADISLATMNRRLREEPFKGAANLIVRPDGQLIAAPMLERELIASEGKFRLAEAADPVLREAYKLIAANPDSTILDDRANDRLIAVGRIEGPDWRFVAIYPKALMASAAVEAVWFIFVLGVFSLLIEVGMLWRVLSRQVVAPLQQFIRATEQIASGDLTPGAVSSLPVSRRDEIGNLAIAFSRMCQSLFTASETRQRAEDELRRHRDRLESMVVERTQALAKTLAQAESASRAKSTFLSNMSHELRTPLNSVIGFSRLMARSAHLDEKEKQNLEIINRSGNHLLTLINDVLELSKIEAGKVELVDVPADISELAQEVVDMLRPRAQQNGLNLNLEIDSLPAVVRVDIVKLRQILINLIGNAIKFTREGSVSLHIRGIPVDEGSTRIEFEVRDTGIGIAPEDQKKILEPFVQLVTHATMAGTGLGLPITQQYLSMLGSTLEIESTPGTGSCFRFEVRLPLVATQNGTATIQRAVPGDGMSAETRQVLIVEDNADARELLIQIIEPLGFEISAAEDGAQALDLVKQNLPDLIIMDWRMPKMDGLEATRQIRAMALPRQPKILMLTASAFEEERDEAFTAGIDDFLRKPLEEDQLITAIKQHLML